PDQDGKMYALADYKGKWLVVYFYPKDFTPGCTKEACGFRDAGGEFNKRGIKIVGISKDSVASHKKFIQKYNLNFTLLADPEHTVIESYGAWGPKKFMGREFFGTIRSTYLINPKGEIVKEYKKVDTISHASQILKDVDEPYLS
ncbi:MAG: thioredoxin-dependent thiol peroxidase, partial [Patescibacteria group bacterium]